jgi:N-carbamoyl-L-amino-acid hydrolase
MSKLHPQIDTTRLWKRVQMLSEFTLPDVPWTRRAFSPLFLEARKWLETELTSAGLAAGLDAGGNLIGRLPGSVSGLKPIITGSHCDTVVGGGRFDGIIGVLAGIEVAHMLREQGISLKHPFEVIDFLSEEPSDYGISCVGSRAFSGLLDANMLDARNPAGETLAAAIRRIGGNPDALSAPLRAPGSTAAFVELHIEQGPVLEHNKLPIGVVTNIVGIQRVRIIVEGQPDHAGTTPMNIRRDALVGAARIIDAIHRRAAAMSGKPHYVVATVGRISMTPNVPNAVPGTVEMMMEVRSESDTVLDTFPDEVIREVQADMRELRLTVAMSHVSRSKPTDCSEIVMESVKRAADELGYESMRLPSGAGHDAVYVAPTGPVGMIFVPCLNGRSHCPEEWIDPAQLAAGTMVLFQTILDLDHKLAMS